MADDERKLMANITPFGLRMQPELRDRVEAAAKLNNRSMNAEIVSRLEYAFDGADRDLLAAQKEIEMLRTEVATQDRVMAALEAQLLQEAEQRHATLIQQREEADKFALLTYRRIPEGLFNRIARIAKRSERTVEEEITQALEKVFPVPRPAAELRQIAAMIENMTNDGKLKHTSEDMLTLAQWLREDADEQDAKDRLP